MNISNEPYQTDLLSELKNIAGPFKSTKILEVDEPNLSALFSDLELENLYHQLSLISSQFHSSSGKNELYKTATVTQKDVKNAISFSELTNTLKTIQQSFQAVLSHDLSDSFSTFRISIRDLQFFSELPIEQHNWLFVPALYQSIQSVKSSIKNLKNNMQVVETSDKLISSNKQQADNQNKLQLRQPYNHNQDMTRNFIGEVSFNDDSPVDFIASTVFQMEQLLSREVKPRHCDISNSPIVGNISYITDREIKTLLPLNMSATSQQKIKNHTVITFAEYNRYQLEISPCSSDNLVSPESKILQETVSRHRLSHTKIEEAINQYLSHFIYVTSDDIHSFICDVARFTGLPRLQVYELLQIGQCNANSMLVNFFLQGIIACGYAGGYYVENGKFYTSHSHSKFVYQVDGETLLHSVESTSHNKFILQNLKLSQADRDLLHNTLEALMHDRSTNAAGKLVAFRPALHQMLSQHKENNADITIEEKKAGPTTTESQNESYLRQFDNFFEQAELLGRDFGQPTSLYSHSSEYFRILMQYNFNVLPLLNQIKQSLQHLDGDLIAETSYGILSNNNLAYSILSAVECLSVNDRTIFIRQLNSKIYQLFSSLACEINLESSKGTITLPQFIAMATKMHEELYCFLESKPSHSPTLLNMKQKELKTLTDKKSEFEAKRAYAYLRLMNIEKQYMNHAPTSGQSKPHRSSKKHPFEKDLFDYEYLRPVRPGDTLDNNIVWSKSGGEQLVKKVPTSAKLFSQEQRRPISLSIDLNPNCFPVHLGANTIRPIKNSCLGKLAFMLAKSHYSHIHVDKIRLTFYGNSCHDEGLQTLLAYFNQANNIADRQHLLEKIMGRIINIQADQLLIHHYEPNNHFDFPKHVHEMIIQHTSINDRKNNHSMYLFNSLNNDLSEKLGINFAEKIYEVGTDFILIFANQSISEFLQKCEHLSLSSENWFTLNFEIHRNLLLLAGGELYERANQIEIMIENNIGLTDFLKQDDVGFCWVQRNYYSYNHFELFVETSEYAKKLPRPDSPASSSLSQLLNAFISIMEQKIAVWIKENSQ